MAVTWADKLEEHLKELEIVNTPDDPRRSVPPFSVAGLDVLDIGCGIGQTLTAAELQLARSLSGVDIIEDAIKYGTARFPNFRLVCAPAEAIPHPASSFDVVFSRVTLPYTDIPKALAEIRRVIRPGGKVWLVLHGVEIERMLWARANSLKAYSHRLYVWTNSIVFNLVGCTFRRPLSKVTESMQTQRGIRKALERAGFTDVVVTRSDSEFSITAKPLRVNVMVFGKGNLALS